ncbi:PP-loop domain-containing protein [Candidatus Magnetoovum chiemensis]|nr:PP-loop domain-containing protein [Candidatus Magnetoovum chiemensis]
MSLDTALSEKYALLLNHLRKYGSAIIAYSGGADSTFLLKAVKDSNIYALAAIGISHSIPKADYNDACEMAKELTINLKTWRGRFIPSSKSFLF